MEILGVLDECKNARSKSVLPGALSDFTGQLDEDVNELCLYAKAKGTDSALKTLNHALHLMSDAGHIATKDRFTTLIKILRDCSNATFGLLETRSEKFKTEIKTGEKLTVKSLLTSLKEVGDAAQAETTEFLAELYDEKLALIKQRVKKVLCGKSDDDGGAPDAFKRATIVWRSAGHAGSVTPAARGRWGGAPCRPPGAGRRSVHEVWRLRAGPAAD